MLKKLLVASILLSTATTFAETYYFSNYERNVSGTNNSWTTSDAWKTADGTIQTGKRPASEDTAVFSKDFLPYGGRDCVVSSGTKVGSIVITNGYAAALAQGDNATLNILGDLCKYYGTGDNASASQAMLGYSGNSAHDFSKANKITVGGNIIVGEADESGKYTINGGKLRLGNNGDLSYSWGAGIGKLTVVGNIALRYSSIVQMNCAYDNDGTLGDLRSYALAKADSGACTVSVGGYLTAQGGIKDGGWWTNPDISLFYRDKGQGGIAIIETRGIKGNFNKISTIASSALTTDSFTILRLTTQAGETLSTTSWIYDNDTSTTLPTNIKSRLMIQMAGEGTMKFGGERMCITGGYDVLSGKLQVRMSNAISALTYSHGTISLRGGKFGSMLAEENVKGQGDMLFTDIEYSSGAIMLYAADSSIDKISLTGYLKKGEYFYDGTKFNFEFSGDLAWLIDNYQLIVSFDNKTLGSDFTKDDFAANNYEKDSIVYNASFDMRDDGLYVAYKSAVPEPAACAALLGIFALGLYFRRNRK